VRTILVKPQQRPALKGAELYGYSSET
jgi:hypothetical protein